MDGKRNKSGPFLQRVRRRILVSTVFMTAFVVGVVEVLVALNIISQPSTMIVAYVVLLITAFAELFLEVRSVSEGLERVRLSVESMQDSRSLRLYSFLDCVDDCTTLLRAADVNIPLTINHLGLDMTNAWNHLRDGVLKQPHFSKTTFNLLMISSDVNALRDANETVQGWSRAAAAQRPKINAHLQEIQRNFQTHGKTLDAKIVDYKEAPIMHGVHISGPFDVYYMGICRWEGSRYEEYEWGEKQYYRLYGPQVEKTIPFDLKIIFDSYFNHLWMKFSVED